MNAQIELKSTGDFIVRSNEVETAYRRIEPFDWDGDGLPNDIDPNPHENDGDYFGQGEDWVRANFTRLQELDAALTNVGQILSVGYTNWVSAAVGVNRTNGLYRLAVRIDEPLLRRTVLSVGEMRVVVTNAGEYVFLLEKGPRCQIECEPNVGELICTVTDDLETPDGNLKYRYEDPPQKLDGELHAHFGWCDGWVQWMPRGEVTPSVTGWGVDNVSEPVTLTARIEDAPQRFSGHWATSNACFRIENPNAPITEVAYDGSTEENCSGEIDYVVDFDGVDYCIGIGFGFDIGRRMRPHVTLSGPSVLFNNDDADPVVDDDRAPVRIGFACDPFYQTNGTLRIVAEGMRLWETRSATETNSLGSIVRFHDFSTSSNLTLYVDRTRGASQSLDDLSIELQWLDDSEGEDATNCNDRIVCRLTALEPVLEPVCNWYKTVNGTNHVINPCCVVNGGRDAWFQLRNIPDWFPSDRIVWSCDDPAVQFVGGNTGSEVCVRATGPTQYGGEGYPALSVRIGDACGSVPKCHFVTVPEVTTIRLHPHIVTEFGSPISHEEITNMVERANDIYSQIGIRFVMDPIETIKVGNGMANVIYCNESSRTWIENLVNHTKGVDVFFVDSIVGPEAYSLIGGNKIVCDASYCPTRTLAHEIGHSLGCNDIFYQMESDHSGATVELPGLLQPERMLEPFDRSNGSGIRYYETSLKWRDVVRRFIMCGTSKIDERLDIPHGQVRGFIVIDSTLKTGEEGSGEIGLRNVRRGHLDDIKE